MHSYLPLPRQVEICCNRGVNGVEGSLSHRHRLCRRFQQAEFHHHGDLSFFYDMNALWNQNYGANIRILLLNNEGGEIFHTLPGMDKSRQFQGISLSPALHHRQRLGEERGFIYMKVTGEEELEEAMQPFTSSETRMQPMLLEVFTDKEKTPPC